MFIHFGPATWQGREYDDLSTPLERINPRRLDTDQWCETAIDWGAKEILFVAKHTGGFCWWQTETSEYSIKNTPYKNGKGDVLKDLSESCEKFGLNLGIYVYPGDNTWGAGIGSGGRTKDPAKQEAYNRVFRQQLTETLTRYGDVWAPIETNTTLYDHYWFWSPENTKKRKSLDHLMECYYRSVGYGSVFLLNSTPDTTGLIPDEDRQLYKAFGEEINRRFRSPIAVAPETEGDELILDLKGQQRINLVVTMEDYRYGQRIRTYSIEGYTRGQWVKLCEGRSVGRKKVDYFPDTDVSKIRLTVTKSVGEPLIRNMTVHFVKEFIAPPKRGIHAWSRWQDLQGWETRHLINS